MLERLKNIGFGYRFHHKWVGGDWTAYRYYSPHIEDGHYYELKIPDNETKPHRLRIIGSYFKDDILEMCYNTTEFNTQHWNEIIDKTFASEIRENTINQILN
tara:strand:- start:4318 stop:4623 length:306 start_codon:yes stop_codon:yes gene_type:complete